MNMQKSPKIYQSRKRWNFKVYGENGIKIYVCFFDTYEYTCFVLCFFVMQKLSHIKAGFFYIYNVANFMPVFYIEKYS